MLSFTVCLLCAYYTFFQLRDWGPLKYRASLAVAQSAAPLIRHCSHVNLVSMEYGLHADGAKY